MRKAVTQLATGGAVPLLLREGFARKQSGMSLGGDVQATLHRAQQLEALKSSTSLSYKSPTSTAYSIVDESKSGIWVAKWLLQHRDYRLMPRALSLWRGHRLSHNRSKQTYIFSQVDHSNSIIYILPCLSSPGQS
jgi:hypothetical protein